MAACCAPQLAVPVHGCGEDGSRRGHQRGRFGVEGRLATSQYMCGSPCCDHASWEEGPFFWRQPYSPLAAAGCRQLHLSSKMETLRLRRLPLQSSLSRSDEELIGSPQDEGDQFSHSHTYLCPPQWLQSFTSSPGSGLRTPG